MIKKILGVVATAAIALGASSAQAVTINGSIGSDVGAVNLTGGSTVATATGIDFVNNFNAGAVNLATGDLAAFFGGDVTFQDFSFSPSSAIPNLYTVSGGLSFDLTSVTSQSVVVGSSQFLLLSGTGIWKLAGFDDTDAVWSLQVNSSNGLSFNASTVSSSVPEPATMGLFGLGLAAVGFVRRRRIAA